MKDLMFPNGHRSEDIGEDIKTPEVSLADYNDEKLREHISLLEREEELETKREKRAKLKMRKVTEAGLRKATKKRQAMAMRLRNIPVDIIAKKLGVSPSYAASLIREAVAELPEETAEDLKKLLGRTVVQLIGNFEKLAMEGGVKEADIMLKGITQLMKLSGLNVRHQQIEQTNMEVGNISPGIDVATLNLDLETKKKILAAIRQSQNSQEKIKEETLQEFSDERDGDNTDEETDSI